MSLNIFNHNSDSSSIKDSFIYNGLHFEIRPSGICTANGTPWYKLIPTVNGKSQQTGISGLADDTIEFGYSIAWEEGPGASMVKKVKEFTNHEAFRMFGGPNRVSNPATNGWTQKFPSDGSVISLSWSFRAYEKDDFMNCTSYMDVIKWLSYVTSPLEEFSFQTELNNIKGSLENAKKSGEEFGKELEAVITSKKEIDTNKLDDVLYMIEDTLTKLGGTSRGTVTFQLGFGNFVKPNREIDWIITSWDFKPSIQYGPNNMPLYVDFNISMETNQKLTTDDFQKLYSI